MRVSTLPFSSPVIPCRTGIRGSQSALEVYARRRIDRGDLGARGVAARRGAQPGGRGAAGTCSARSPRTCMSSSARARSLACPLNASPSSPLHARRASSAFVSSSSRALIIRSTSLSARMFHVISYPSRSPLCSFLFVQAYEYIH